MKQSAWVYSYVLNVVLLDQSGGDHDQESCHPIFFTKPLTVNIVEVLIGPGIVMPPFGFLHADNIIAHFSDMRLQLLKDAGRKPACVPREGTPGVGMR